MDGVLSLTGKKPHSEGHRGDTGDIGRWTRHQMMTEAVSDF